MIFFSVTGLTAFVTMNCTDSEPYFSKNLVWSDYLNPCLLLLLYFYFAFEKILFQRVNFIEKFFVLFFLLFSSND
jgi:hypothetical protein